MKEKVEHLNKIPSLKIVLVYTAVSAVYIYTSDYFLQLFTSDITLLSKLQTFKGLGFIFITSTLLYVLVKRNLDVTTAYFGRIIEIQKNSDLQLMQSKEEYMFLFNHSPLPMWLFDIETLQFLLVNDAACEAYGFSREEFLCLTLRDIRPAEDLSTLEESVSRMRRNLQYTFPNILRHKKKNGEVIQVKLKNTFVNFSGKKVRLASVTDVTSEMSIQNKLMESNSRLQMASEIAGLGYWSNDLVNSEIIWSDEIYKIFEQDPQTFELSLKSISALFHPEDQFQFDPESFFGFENREIKENESRIITPSGKIKWLLERQYFTKNKQGIPIQIQGIVLDITKRKLFEEQIKESNERFKMLAKATVEAIIDWDIKNNEVTWGEGFRTMLGYDLSQTNYRLWSGNIHCDDRKEVLNKLNTALADPAQLTFNAEFRFLKANGEIAFVQHRGIFIRDANGRATRALGAMIDLTEALEKMKRIEWQEKTLRDIAWIQSHVVRAPLANLMGLVELINSKTDTGVSDEVLLGYISESAHKLDAIIRDIVSKTVESAETADKPVLSNAKQKAPLN